MNATTTIAADTATALLALADRVEALTVPCREVDAEIAIAVLGYERDGSMFYGIDRDYVLERDYYSLEGSPQELPSPTASLDAAMTLVPEGIGVSIQRYWIARVDGPVWSAEIATGGLPDKPRRVFDCYDAPTPALALCSAALRARARAST